MAMWSLLGARKTTLLAWVSFGDGWVTDAVKQLKIDADVVQVPSGVPPHLTRVDHNTAAIFHLTGTPYGVGDSHGALLRDQRPGLLSADANPSVFALRTLFGMTRVDTCS